MPGVFDRQAATCDHTNMSLTVGEAVLVEVAPVMGLAQLHAEDGRVLRMTRETSGVALDDLRTDGRYRCAVVEPYADVIECREWTDGPWDAEFAAQVGRISRILEHLRSGEQFGFWARPKGSLGGTRPLEALRRGLYRQVRVAAEGFAER